MVGPDVNKKPKSNKWQWIVVDEYSVVLDNLPLAELYERSYMHKEAVNHVIAATKMNCLVTISIDGHVKIWKKVFSLIEFGKHFRAHAGFITCAAINIGHERMITVSPADKTIKIFDL